MRSTIGPERPDRPADLVGSFDELSVDEGGAVADEATSWGALSARQRSWAASMSL
jgi:hypothetical protein